jgi:hypothetical protein
MNLYSMATRNGSIVTRKEASNLEEAIDLFSRLKGLPKDQFLKLFKVIKSD